MTQNKLHTAVQSMVARLEIKVGVVCKIHIWLTHILFNSLTGYLIIKASRCPTWYDIAIQYFNFCCGTGARYYHNENYRQYSGPLHDSYTVNKYTWYIHSCMYAFSGSCNLACANAHLLSCVLVDSVAFGQ